MPRRFILSILCVIASLPSSLLGQYAGAPYSLPAAEVFRPFVSYTVPSDVSIPKKPPDVTRANELLDEVERLKREVQRLREDQQQLRQFVEPPREPQPQSQAAKETSLPVILVFRDGHEMEAQGYAIVGETLWAVTEQTSTKISLSTLDLEATQKKNSNRGVQFPLPRKR
jgi:hypothetical protein